MVSARIPKILSLLFLLVGLSACTRPQEELSKISVAVPRTMTSNKIGTLATTEQLMHLIINVNGPNIPQTIVFQWDGHDSDTIAAAPSSFDLDLPMGSGRLIQVLAVYASSTSAGSDSQAMTFYYGDLVKDLTSSLETANIAVSSLGQGQPIIGGNVYGRYLTAANSGPSGRVDIKFTPTGKPPMIIDRGKIVNGWFNVFMLQGASLTYEVSDGNLLFGGPVSLDSPQFTTNSAQTSRVTIPVAIRKQYISGSPNYSWGIAEPNIYVYGWFGPAATGKYICHPTSFSAFTNLGKVQTTMPALNGAPTNYLNLSTNSTLPTVAAIMDTTTPMAAALLAFGSDSATGPCTGAAELVDKITLAQSWWDGNGSDNAAPFYPPFKKSNSYGPFNITMAAGVATIAGEVLPGLAPSAIDRLVFFKRVANDNWRWNENVFPCEMAAAGAFGFVQFGEVTLSTSTFSTTLPMSTTEASQSGTMALVCPAKGPMLLGAGEMIRSYNFSSGGGGGGMSPATKLAITAINSTPSVNLCSQFQVKPVDASNALGSITTGSLTVSFTVSGAVSGTTSLFQDPMCLVPLVTPYVDQSGKSFYIKGTATGTATVTAVYVSGNTPSLTNSTPVNLTFQTAPALASFGFLPDLRYSRQAFECIDFHLIGRGGAGGTGGEVDLYNMQPINLTGTTFYSDPNCATITTGFPVYAAHSSIYPLFIRPTVSGPVSVTASHGSGTACPGPALCTGSYNSYPISPNPGGVATQLKVNYATNAAPTVGQCNVVSVEVYDTNFWPAPVGSALSVTVSLSGGTNCTNPAYIVLTDADCVTAPNTTKTVSIPGGENRVLLGIKNVAPSSGSCTITATSGGLSNGTMSTNW